MAEKIQILVLGKQSEPHRWEQELHDEGFSVRVAKDSKTALDDLEEKGADCIVVNLDQPDQDGLALLRQIKSDGRGQPIFILTGDKEMSRALRLLQAATGEDAPRGRAGDEIAVSSAQAGNNGPAENGVPPAQTTLREREEQLRLALEAARIGTWTWDIQSLEMSWDERLHRTFGLEPGGFGGTVEDFVARVHPDDVPRVQAEVDRVLAHGSHLRIDYRTVCPDKTIRHVESRGSILRDENGKACRLAGVCLDITDRKQTEDELKKLNATLEYQRASALSLMRDAEEAMIKGAQAKDEIRRSHQFLDSILENLPNIVVVLDAEELRYMRINRAGEELLGCAREELIGRTELEVYPPEEAAELLKAERKVASEHCLVEIPERITRTASGETRILDTKVVPIVDDDGDVQYLLTISEDITKRKQAEEALARERNLLRTVIDNVPDFIYAKDVGGFYILNNTAHISFLGARMAVEVLGRSDGEFSVQESEQRLREEQEIMDVGGSVMNKEEPVVDKTGEKRWISTTKVPLRDPRGQIQGLVGIGRDVTERKKAYEAMDRLVQQLAQSNVELEQFAYVASHDLQEPLRKIQAFGGRLLSRVGSSLDAESGDYLERIQNAAGRMQNLITDLLSLSRVTSRAQPFVAVDLNTVLSGVLVDLEVRIEQVGAQIEVDQLPVIDADRTQMRQLMQNLISNALKFHRPDVPPVVKLRASTENAESPDIAAKNEVGEWCEITVEDNGIGFDEKYANRIFQLFQRLHGRSQYEGTGVGLAVCRKIVERHGGTISAQGKPGEGAKFVVMLPIRQSLRETAA